MIGAGLESGWEALWANRLRSLLTVLGVIVGVAAVIAVVTLDAGHQRVAELTPHRPGHERADDHSWLDDDSAAPLAAWEPASR